MEVNLRRSLLIVFSLVVFSAVGRTQEFEQPRGLGYFFVAPGRRAGSLKSTRLQFGPGGQLVTREVSREFGGALVQFGAGGERLVYRGLGFGAELGGVNAPDERFGLFSANASYHFVGLKKNPRLIPFITGGITRVGTSESGESWLNLGGGVNYWFHNRAALRLEVRDQLDLNHSTPLQYLGFRIGMSFR